MLDGGDDVAWRHLVNEWVRLPDASLPAAYCALAPSGARRAMVLAGARRWPMTTAALDLGRPRADTQTIEKRPRSPIDQKRSRKHELQSSLERPSRGGCPNNRTWAGHGRHPLADFLQVAFGHASWRDRVGVRAAVSAGCRVPPRSVQHIRHSRSGWLSESARFPSHVPRCQSGLAPVAQPERPVDIYTGGVAAATTPRGPHDNHKTIARPLHQQHNTKTTSQLQENDYNTTTRKHQ